MTSPRTVFDIAFSLTHHAVQPTRIIIRPELYQAARNLFARLAWQEWWRCARIFGFRNIAVKQFKGWEL